MTWISSSSAGGGLESETVVDRSDCLVALEMAPPGPILGRSPHDDDDEDEAAPDGAGKHHAINKPMDVLIFMVFSTSFPKKEFPHSLMKLIGQTRREYENECE